MVKQIGKPTEGGWGWLVVGASFIIRVLIDGIVCSFGVLAVPLITDFGASRQLVGWTGSLLAGTSLCLGPIANWACTHLGCRKVVISGTIVAVSGMIISSFATEPWILVVSYGFVVGVGSCFVLLPTIVCVAYYFDKQRSLVLGLTSCGSGVGVFLMGYISEFLVLTYGWSSTMMIEAGLLLNCCAFGIIIVEPQVQVQGAKHGSKSQNCNLTTVDAGMVANINSGNLASEVTNTELQSSHQLVGRLINEEQCTQDTKCDKSTPFPQQDTDGFTIPSNSSDSKLLDFTEDSASKVEVKKGCAGFEVFYNMSFTFFMMTSFITCLGTFVPYLFLADRAYNLGYSLESSANLILMIGVFNLFGRVSGGVLGDRKFVNRLALLTGCLTVCGIVICCIAIRFSYWFLAICAVVFGFCIGVVVALLPAVLVDLVSLAHLSSALGFSGLFGGTGYLFGPPLAGILFDTTESYETTFVVMGLIVIIGSLSNIVIFFMPSYKKVTSNQPS